MTHKQALTKAYNALSPYSDPQIWEFNNNLVHLRFNPAELLIPLNGSIPAKRGPGRDNKRNNKRIQPGQRHTGFQRNQLHSNHILRK